MDGTEGDAKLKKLLQELDAEDFYQQFYDYGIESHEIFKLKPKTLKLIIPEADLRIDFISKINNHQEKSKKKPAEEKQSKTNNVKTKRNQQKTNHQKRKKLKIEAANNSCNESMAPNSINVESLDFETDSTRDPLGTVEITEVENEIHSLLLETFRGRIVLETYSKLSKFNRKDLCRIIIDHEFENLPDTCSIHATRFQALAKQIVELFPLSEKVELYYTPYSIDSFGKSVWAGGLLYDMYKHVRSELRAIGRLVQKRASGTCNKRTGVSMDKSQDSAKIMEAFKDSDVTPEIMEKWKKTYNLRKNIFSQQETHATWEMVKCLQSYNVYDLVHYDFSKEFPGAQNLFEIWPTLSRKIMNYALTTKRDEEIQKLLDDYDEPIEEDHLSTLALLCLPLLLGTSSKKSKDSNKRITLSNKEVQQGFLLHLETPEEIDEYNTNLMQNPDLDAEGNISFAPYCGIVGTVACPTECYVVMNKYRYIFNSPLQAVDFAFKVCLAFKIPFSLTCPHVWCFFQRYVYNVGNSKKFAKVTELFMNLEQLQ